MDDVKRKTLFLMQETTRLLSIPEAGRHLLMIAADWVTEGDLAKARNALEMITDFYYDNHMLKQISEDNQIAETVALLIETFGVTDFRYLRDTGIKA